ncbi:hypothetical protein C8R44DRAFT_989899 [Mycena epipterygia]|nr:hypothetical protein C8R44DRAFT_989899 [Mycena epipterygia]
MSRLAKSASLIITLCGALTHSFLTVQLAGSWRTLRALDAENDLDAWKLDGLKVLFALLALYLQAGAFVSFVGFYGVLKNKASHVRLYRDCSAADLAFTVFITVLAGYAAWAPGRLACEELARQPELAQLLALLSPDETCERWLERAAITLLSAMVVLTVVRLHFLLAVSTHYAHLLRLTSAGGPGGEQCIRLLPLPPNVPAADVVYAPVHCPSGSPLDSAGTAEVWVRAQQPTPAQLEADAGLLDARVVRSKREYRRTFLIVRYPVYIPPPHPHPHPHTRISARPHTYPSFLIHTCAARAYSPLYLPSSLPSATYSCYTPRPLSLLYEYPIKFNVGACSDITYGAPPINVPHFDFGFTHLNIQGMGVTHSLEAAQYRKTNGKNAEHQISIMDENEETMARIQMAVDEWLESREEDEKETDPRVTSVRIEAKNQINSTFRDFNQKLREYLARHHLAYVVRPDQDIQIEACKVLYVDYQSKVDWKLGRDILRCNAQFHGRSRYDSIIYEAHDKDLAMGQLEMVFCWHLPRKVCLDLAMIKPYCKSFWAARTHTDCPMREWGPRSTFIALEHVTRGALLCPIFGASREVLYVIDCVDEDMLLRVNEIG